MKKRTRPEYGKTDSEPLSQEALDWYLSMLDATPSEKADQMVEYFEKPVEGTLDEKTTNQRTTKNIR